MEAARRQLETAIKLFFIDGEVVSIHTLTSAAYQVLYDVNRAICGKPMIKDMISQKVKPNFIKIVLDKFNESTNYFKHADRDYNDIHEFKPEETEINLFDACLKYYELTQDRLPLMRLYTIWYMLQYGILIEDKAMAEAIEKARIIFPNKTRYDFYLELLPIVNDLSLLRQNSF